MHHFQFLVHSRAPGDQEPFGRVFSSESSRREFLRRAAAVGISASAAVTLLGALAEHTVAAAGTDILTAQAPTLIPGGWGAGYLSQYLVNLGQQIQLEAIGGIDIETDGPGHVLMIAVEEGSLDQERLVGVLKEAFVGHEVEVVRLTTASLPLPDGKIANLPAALDKLTAGGTQPINSLIMGQNADGQLAVQVTLAASATRSRARG